MDKFFDTVILDNKVGSYLIVAGIVLFLLLFKRHLSRYLASLLYLLVKKKWHFIEKSEFISMLFKPLGWFITITISVMAIDKLNFPAAWQFKIYGETTDDLLQKMGNILIVLYFTLFLIRSINFVSLFFEHRTRQTEDKADDQLIFFFRDFLKVLIGIIGFLLILKVGFNQDIGALLTGLSIVGAALALAAKESLENLIASFIIFFDKPFFTGDTLIVNNVSGTVEHIGLRSTRIRTNEQTLVTVPNKQMVDSVVDNLSNRLKRRGEIRLEFASRMKAGQLEDFISFVKTRLDQKKETITNFSVYLSNLSKTGSLVTIEFFSIPFTLSEFFELRQEVILMLKKELEEKSMELSVPLGEF
ncbi:MAG: mechanosensitive ion channel family protein, partial [Bacteroidetes bacterium]|nr:mechanosensitive ion channel family protein [Bacteroidota bacterium]